MRFVMGSIGNGLKDLWVCTSALQVSLLVLVVVRRQFQKYPAFSLYLFIGLLQSAAVYGYYAKWGYDSLGAFKFAWVSQAIVVAARATAVCEICYHVLGQFRGVWGLAWRMMVLVAVAVLITALTLGQHDFLRTVSTVDLGLECAMAAAMVVFFLFAKHYEVQMSASHRYMGVAFCLYSCFRVLNDAVLQKLSLNYSATWNMVDEVTFLATMLVLARAAYGFQSATIAKVVLLPSSVYANLIPQVNQRLRVLNEKLGQLLKSETGKV